MGSASSGLVQQPELEMIGACKQYVVCYGLILITPDPAKSISDWSKDR